MKKMSVQITAFAATFMLVPAIALAQFGGVNEFFSNITNFINNILIPLVFAIALLVFLYGVFKYFILGGGDPENRKEGTQLMLYSVIGFVLMVSIFGIVNLIANGLGFSDDQDIQSIPNAPTTNN
ncbi:MAG: pilin [Candidatus Paceibacterota bacterium]